MKKTFVTLLVFAIAVWGYVVFRIILVLTGGPDSIAASQVRENGLGASLFPHPSVPLDAVFRDPFQSYLYSQKPTAQIPKSAVGRPAALPAEPPKAVLNGILWSDEPVAILRQDGQTELVKKGTSVWDIKIIRIDRNQVVVRKQGRQFTLAY